MFVYFSKGSTLRNKNGSDAGIISIRKEESKITTYIATLDDIAQIRAYFAGDPDMDKFGDDDIRYEIESRNGDLDRVIYEMTLAGFVK